MAPLSPQLFGLLAAIVEEQTGLHYGLTELPIFSERIHARMTEAGFESPLDYYYFLRYDPQGAGEMLALTDALVVGETYLFRESDALRAAMSTVIHPAIAERGVARVWSAACATGEEPFTLAMLCAAEGILPKVSLVATDISQRAIARARAGKLSPRALRMLGANLPGGPPAWMKQLADRWVQDGVMAKEIVDAIDLRRESLIGSDPLRRDLDLILCRNVLIYFRDEVVRDVVEMLTGHLRPGGRLLVGASESLLRFGTSLRCEERGGAFFYVKP